MRARLYARMCRLKRHQANEATDQQQRALLYRDAERWFCIVRRMDCDESERKQALAIAEGKA